MCPVQSVNYVPGCTGVQRRLRDEHHRRPIRLVYWHGAPCPNHCQPGAYFVTICTREQECLFGHLVNGEMRLNPLGRMATACWRAIPHHFPRVGLG